jgi:hypothetical protein
MLSGNPLFRLDFFGNDGEVNRSRFDRIEFRPKNAGPIRAPIAFE